MRKFDYDLFVIGAGSGGVRASRLAAGHGARVGICEEHRVGGTCVIRGCVPKKLLVYGAHFGEDFEDAAGYGWTLGPAEFDWRALIANKDREIDRLNGVYERLLADAGVELIEARGEFSDPHTVELGTRRVTAAKILIASGSWPSMPALPGAELAISSNEAFHLERLPAHVVIYGGGYIAVEFAGIFRGLGARVTLVYRGPLLLRGFDQDVREALGRELVNKGIDLRLERIIERIERTAGGLEVRLDDGESLACEQALFATGRRPNTGDLGLERAGVAVDAAGAVVVDRFSRTSVPHIFAVGDVTDRLALTPVALMEGQAFAQTEFGGEPTPVDHRAVPSAVFSLPPVGTVGLTEVEAREKYGRVDVYRSTFRPLKHTLSGRDALTMMKLVVDQASQRVVGCHVVGEDAPEIVQGVGIAVRMGATKAQFDATVGIHPTAAEELVTMRAKVA